MSEFLTIQQQELSEFLTLLLRINASTKLFANFFNPITPANVGLDPDMFKSLDKKSRQALKVILTNAGVRFEGHGMTFPQNYEDLIPHIVEEFLKQWSPQIGGAVAEEFPRAVCGGGGAAEAPSSTACGGWGSTGWGVPKPKHHHDVRCAGGGARASSNHLERPILCPNAGGTCKFYNTWGGCRNIHPENDPKNGELPEKGGPTIAVCKNGPQCERGKECTFPHPGNDSCVVKEISLRSRRTVFLVKVCTLKKCYGIKCQCAHLPPGVVSEALKRKENAFSKSGRGFAHSAVVVLPDAVSPVSFDNSWKNAHDEVAHLTGNFESLSIDSDAEDVVCCGGGACAVQKPQQRPVCEGDLLGFLENLSVGQTQQPAQLPPPSAPPLVLSSFGQWDELVDPKTGLSYYQNHKMATMVNPKNIFQDACCAVAEPHASCAVVCCAVVRRRKVLKNDALDANDASKASKASKRPSDSQSGPDRSKK